MLGSKTAAHWDKCPWRHEWSLHRHQPRHHPRHRYVFDRYGSGGPQVHGHVSFNLGRSWLWRWQRLNLGHWGELWWLFEKFAPVDILYYWHLLVPNEGLIDLHAITSSQLRGEVGGSSLFNLTGRGISNYRRRVKAATVISAKVTNSRHMMTMVRMTSILPSNAGASNRAGD
jgi:hypothetical protein